MSESNERKKPVENEPTEPPDDALAVGRAGAFARRAVLRRGAKLVYIVPAVLAAMSAKTAFAAS